MTAKTTPTPTPQTKTAITTTTTINVYEQVLSAIATIMANVFFGYSRDTTSSYKQDLYFLVILCFVCLAITVFLVIWDNRDGRPVLNRGKRLLRSDVKVLG